MEIDRQPSEKGRVQSHRKVKKARVEEGGTLQHLLHLLLPLSLIDLLGVREEEVRDTFKGGIFGVFGNVFSGA